LARAVASAEIPPEFPYESPSESVSETLSGTGDPDAGPPEPRVPERRLAEWRGLGVFWVVALGVLAVGGATLQVLGPPVASPAGRLAVASPHPDVVAPPGRISGGPIASPNPALLERAPASAPRDASRASAPGDTSPASAPGDTSPAGAPGDASGAGLPRIAPDGRTPMQAYAARFNTATTAPRITILIAGVGLDEAASEAAIHALPAAITLAVSPYAATPDAVAAVARRAGDETLVSIPLEPQGYALNDPGRRALLTTTSPGENARRLDWVLSRFAGYVGATGALGDMRGERFAEVPDQMDPMLTTLAARGLLYVDPRPGAARLPYVWSRTVDVVIDDPPTAAAIDAHLADLEKRAHDTGAALGLIGAIRPVTMEHLIAWVGNLAGRGYALAPVSAIATAPNDAPPTGEAPPKEPPREPPKEPQ
jgi:polysaccharide deacetylase 2 family uncharacterized protein YibQ